MTPERWRQIEEVFHEALELRDPARAELISSRSVGDPELADEVKRLLEQYEEASDFIEQPLYDSARDGLLSALLDETGEDPMIGKVLGSYRIEREIGRGGMGAVYEASRADGEFRLRVAVKVVKRGVDTDFVLRRFRNERQILATLDHPFITRLIDGGSTDDGRPYFVMEYIDGYPLYRYCDKHKLSMTEKLKLFCRVTQAVEYAHQKRVIHRDLKPSNIFITNDGSPRLLDFGIAKLLDPEMAVDTLHPTATALRMMTVDYASPEQVRGEAVTYATDVYSLGVILFELLTGYKPYKLASRSSHDVARAICDEAPLVASELVRGTIEGEAVKVNQSATTIAGATDIGIETSRLAEQLKGSLDNIIAKALKKKPDERYASVADFRRDIERHLKGESIAAPAPEVDETSVMPQRDPDGKFLAVLPLTLMSPAVRGNTDEAYLTVGLADAIITRLAAVHRLTVRPTSSITRYDEHHINPLRAGRELGVDYVLDGRIRRFGERLRISLQLLDVHSASAIWAGQFDEHLTDVLELEDAISEQVAAALIPQLTGEDLQKLAKRGTNNVAAYEAYMRGRFHWNQFTAQSFPKALEAFETAVKLDPNYALAYVGVADFYIWGNIYGVVTAEETHNHAEAAARRALQIDDQLGEAYASMALIELNRYAYEKAERLFQRSIELNPHNSLAHEWYSAVLIGTGRFREGLDQMLIAETLDPLSLRTKIMVGWNHCQAGDLRTALQKADEAIALDDNYPQAHIQRGYYLCDLGRPDEAVKELEFANLIMKGSSLAEFNLCIAYAAAGRTEDANRVADSMFERSRTEYIKPMFLCFAATAVGRIDEAFHQLEIAVDERDPWLIWLGTDRKLARLRTDPRFTELMHRTRKTFVDGTVTILGNAVQHETGGGYREAETIPFDDHQTAEFRRGFLRRNLKPLAAAAVVILGIFAAYVSGFLTVSITRDPPPSSLVKSGETANRSIAVLPFTNSTNDPANDYLADGISENLIDSLAMTPAIKVVSRSAVFSFKGKQVDPRDVGRDLGVENILVGSVNLRDGQYVISTELINVSDGIRVFASDFASSADRSFALPAEIAQRIYQSLNVRDEAASRLQRRSTSNNEAFQLYLKAEFARQKARPADVENSIRMYQQAAELDPQYALAFQGLALAYRSAPAYGVMPPAEAYPKAQAAAQTALSLDPNLSSVHVALAGIKATHEWDFPGAEVEYKRAIALAPNNGEGLYSYANFLVAMGRTDEALEVYRSAQQVDPLSLNIATNVSWALYIAGRNDEALEQINGVIARDPSFARAYLNLGEILEEMGRYDEAISAIQKANTLSRDPITEMALGHVYASAGRRREAENIAADLEARVRANKLSPFMPAVVYAGLKDNDKAFYWLERAYQERSNWLTLIKVGRRLAGLRGDPRFDDLLHRIGFRS